MVASENYIVIQRCPGARLRLICFPFAGRGAGVFANWGRLLGDQIELIAIQLPGRETRWREPCISDMQLLIASMTEALEPLLDLPFVLFGHSLGGLLAFETARSLRRNGLGRPETLIVSARHAPHVAMPAVRLHELPDRQFLREMQTRYGEFPAGVLADAELLQLVTSCLRADVKLIETYRYEADDAFDFPITAFGGREDRQVGADGLTAWRDQTSGPFDLALFDGGHFFIRDARDAVLPVIREKLRAHRPHRPVPAPAFPTAFERR